jgi:perosamine synthetase
MKGKLAVHGGSKTVPEGLKRAWPVITEEDKKAVLSVLDRGILAGVAAPEVTALEKEFAEFNGSKYAMATGSGTSAIHCALFAAGVQPGDEVITSAYSFSGSFHPILQQNAIPVFVDIDPRTYNVDARKIEAKISDKTKVILPVHIHGLPSDMDEIMNLAGKHDLTVIEDACQAHGAEYKGKKSGTIGKAGAFSLNVTKNLSGGEGGIMVSDDEDFVDRAKRLRTFGEKPSEYAQKTRGYTVYSVGYQYRTQELPAALARSQLRRLEGYNSTGRRNSEYLTSHLGKIPGLKPPHVPADRTSIYYKYRIRFDPQALGLRLPARDFRNRLCAALESEGVSVALWHVEPLPAFPIFQEKIGWGKGCPWSCQHYGREITYRREDYPEAIKLLDESFIVGDELYPLFSQDMKLMEYYVQAFQKVFSNLDELL